MNIQILKTFAFKADVIPYSLLGYWGCAYANCPHDHKVRPGEMCHKIKHGDDVDLIHVGCWDKWGAGSI